MERARAEAEAIVRGGDIVQRSAADTASNIKSKAEVERRNRDRAEAEARYKSEAEIK